MSPEFNINKLSPAIKRVVGKVILGTPLAALLMSSGTIDNKNVPAPNIKIPTPVSDKPLEETWSFVGTAKVYFNNEHLPIKYVKNDGAEIVFDIQKTKQIKDRAIISGEPEILTVIIHEIESAAKNVFPYSKEHPKTKELPEDVLSKEDLEKRGVKIIQADNTNLYIREGAFTKDAPLADFNSTGRQLTVVLLEGTEVSRHFMNDPRYSQFRKLLPEKHRDINKYKEKQIEFLEKELKNARLDFKKQNSMSEPYITWLKTQVYKYKKALSDEQILAEILDRFPDNIGSYFAKDKVRSVIYVAVGTPMRRPRTETIIFFDQSGATRTQSEIVYAGIGTQPMSNQTHLDPASFLQRLGLILNPPPLKSDYRPYGGITPGFVLRHEIAHDQLITQRVIGGEKENRREYDTDIKAMEGIRNAWEKWEKSGFTDNSGYYFVFSLPEGGYILTEHRQSNANTPPGT